MRRRAVGMPEFAEVGAVTCRRSSPDEAMFPAIARSVKGDRHVEIGTTRISVS